METLRSLALSVAGSVVTRAQIADGNRPQNEFHVEIVTGVTCSLWLSYQLRGSTFKSAGAVARQFREECRAHETRGQLRGREPSEGRAQF